MAVSLFSTAASLAQAAGIPYSGTAIAVPGRIQAEDFDKGGEGVGYHEITPGNQGGQYRPGEAVDIIASTDPDGGAYVVSSFHTGEWLAYTVNVTTAGRYDLGIRAANNGAPGAFHIEVDGVNVTGTVAVTSTGSWDAFGWFVKGGIELPAGQHVLKLVADAQYFNVNALSVTSASGTAGAAAGGGTPYSGTPVTLPGTIEAENFDKGGEGAGFHEVTAGNVGGQYRTGESVDIIASADPAGGAYVVNNFHTGEWLAYTVNVPVAGNYDLAIRAASNGAAGAFHIEVDGVNVTGSVPVSGTGGWNQFAWYGKTGIPLKAGRQVLKLVADSQYFNVNSIRAVASASASASSGTSGTPYGGTPIALPLVFEAENFDRGGQNVGYYDKTPANLGGGYRTSESVDIIASTDSIGGAYAVSNFEKGEWLAYTVNIPVAGSYDVFLRVANNGAASAFHVEVDGADQTGPITVANTGGWDKFGWAGKDGVILPAGRHVIKVVSDAQYFNLNSISIMPSDLTSSSTSASTSASTSTSTTATTATTALAPGVAWLCDFENGSYCAMSEHSKLENSGGRRSSMVSVARSGKSGMRLHTEPGDNNIHGSGTWERNDLSLEPSGNYCNQGQEEWWGHSILFPDDYVFPPGPEMGAVFDFHHNSSSGMANFNIQMVPGVGMRLRGYGGNTLNEGQYDAVIRDPFGAQADVARNRWYDFNYRVKWSSGSDGFMIAWLNGRKVLSYSGPTLYGGISCYLKLANYHAPNGRAMSVVHDRIIRGNSAAAVSLWTLE